MLIGHLKFYWLGPGPMGRIRALIWIRVVHKAEQSPTVPVLCGKKIVHEHLLELMGMANMHTQVVRCGPDL